MHFTYQVQLANRISRGRACGNEWVAVKLFDGAVSGCIVARFGEDRAACEAWCAARVIPTP